MYRIEKSFKFPMGHRLLKNDSDCYNIHGHNYTVKIGLKSRLLNRNDMVIDFSYLKEILTSFFKCLDHCTMVNSKDKKLLDILKECDNKYYMMESDPTAERMAEEIYVQLNNQLSSLRDKAENQHLLVEYVTVFESDDSSATYSED